jgi:hypothetical protein
MEEFKHITVLSFMIQALSTRFPDSIDEWLIKGQSYYDIKYASEMEILYHKFGRFNDDISALYAESWLTLTPWKYYTEYKSEKLIADIKPKLKDPFLALQSLMSKGSLNPLALHLYIHVVEQSNHPETGEKAADQLYFITREKHMMFGHLIHMPAHIYIRVGR